MSQKKFLILIEIKTDLSLDLGFKTDEKHETVEFNFKFGDDRLLIREIKSERDKLISGINQGLIIEAQVFGENFENSIKKAIDLSEFIASTASLETGSPIYGSKIVLAYDITPKVHKRLFRQYFYDLYFTGFNKLFGHPFKVHAQEIYDLEEERRYRVLRAIRWFRKGLIGNDPIDQFTFLWQGLESLNPILANHFKVENTIKTVIKCKKCNKKFEKKGPALNGIKALYDDLKIDKTTRTEIKDIRVGIVHGHSDIVKLYEPTIKIIPKMAEILHYGISKVLQIDFDIKTYDNIKRGTTPIKIGDFIFLEGFLIEENLSNLGVKDYYPYFDPEVAPKIITPKIEFNFKPEKDFLGCEFEMTGIGVSGKDLKIDHKNTIKS